jgi:hypothetical protein
MGVRRCSTPGWPKWPSRLTANGAAADPDETVRYLSTAGYQVTAKLGEGDNIRGEA